MVHSLSGFHLHVRQRPRAAGENITFLDFFIENTAIVVHLHLAGKFQHPAGAANSRFAGSADAHTGSTRRHENRLAGLARHFFSRNGEAHHRERFAIRIGKDALTDGDGGGRREAFLMVTAHVEA